MPVINDCVNYIYSYQNEIIKIEYIKSSKHKNYLLNYKDNTSY